jgi:hypothetical protein
MRLILILLVMLVLAPGTWIRSALPPLDLAAPVVVTPLAMPHDSTGEVQLLGGWKMTSQNDHFGGYSALLALDGEHLLAASDRGRIIRLAFEGGLLQVGAMDFLATGVQPDKGLIDVESMTRDPATGQLWLGYEAVNAVERVNSALEQPVRVHPAQMREWPTNKGAEAMARLDDGRFILIAEGSKGWGRQVFAGLVFPGDPVAGGAAQEFRFDPPEGYRPVDMVQIPDGRVLILVRKLHWQIMPRFTAKLVLADPAEIRPGKNWSGKIIAELSPPIPSDNYEGLAMWPRDDGQLDLWVISDDNGASFQHTYLMHMRWNPQIGEGPASAR